MTDTKVLREKIDNSGYKLRFIAKQLGISYQCLLKKINNETEFKATEIQALSSLIKANIQEREQIFFAH